MLVRAYPSHGHVPASEWARRFGKTRLRPDEAGACKYRLGFLQSGDDESECARGVELVVPHVHCDFVASLQLVSADVAARSQMSRADAPPSAQIHGSPDNGYFVEDILSDDGAGEAHLDLVSALVELGYFCKEDGADSSVHLTK